MVKFVGCKEAKEVSLTPTGANQHAHALFTRTAPENDPAPAAVEKANPQTSAENDIMSLKNLQRVASMSDVTKTYFVSLDETAGTAFLEKSVEDQDKEAAAAKKTADEAASAAAAKAAGISERELAAEKRADAAEKRLADVEKKLDDQAAATAIEKAAASPDFDGYPGGASAVAAILKSIAGLSEEAQKPVIENMKSTAQASKMLGSRFGLQTETVEKGAGNKLRAAVKSYAEANKISEREAFQKVIEKAENAHLVADADAEGFKPDF